MKTDSSYLSKRIVDRTNIISLNMFYLLLLVDSINGFFLDKGLAFPISQCFKIVLLFFMSFQLMRNLKGNIVLWLISFYSAILILFYSFFDSFSYSLTFSHLFKYLLLLCTYYYFSNILSSYPLRGYAYIINIFKINSSIVILNILLALVGLGSNSYGDIGSKGYFHAANELSGLLLIFCPFFLFYIGKKYTISSFKYVGTLSIFLLTVLLLGTKASIISFFISAFYISSILVKNRKAYLKLCLLVILSIVCIVFWGYHILESLGFWDRWSFFYDKGGLQLLILSGRDEYWQNEKGELLSGGISSIIMGIGGSRTVEMDIFDTFLNYGIIGVLVVYSFFIYLLYIANSKKRENPWAKMVLYIDIMLLIVSSFSGHIIFSGMASPFIAILNVLVLISPQNYKNEDIFSV